LLVGAHRRAAERLQSLWRVAELAHPNRPLERGYARVEDQSGRTLVSAAAAREAARLRLVFRDGKVDASVGEGSERPRRVPAKPRPTEQPKLL
jgi:exodeoxyribonuclease VII large subunit